MPFMPRRIAAATITVVALGAGAAPALASARTPLATTIARVTPYVDENVALGTRAQEAAAIPALNRNITACNRYAEVVIDVHADRAQHAAQLDWVTGVRLAAAGDEQLVAGLYAPLHHNPEGGGPTNPEIQAGLATLGRADVYEAQADRLLNLH